MLCVLICVTSVMQNAASMIMNIAKNVQRLAKHVQKNAEKCDLLITLLRSQVFVILKANDKHLHEPRASSSIMQKLQN